MTISIQRIALFLFLAVTTIAQAQSKTLKKKLLQTTKGKEATVAVSVLSLDDDFKLDVNINGDKKLPMQSVFKFPIALAVLDRVDQGDYKINNLVLVTRNQLLENTWSPMRDQLPKTGNVKTRLNLLLNYMVSESDNNAADILLKLIGGAPSVQKFIDNQGIKDFSIKFNEEEMHKILDTQYQNYITTNSLNQLFKKFNEGKILQPESTAFLMKALINTSTGKNRLVAELPATAVVAHKTGTSFTVDQLTAAVNDAGIVTLPNGKQYAISVFVSDSHESEVTNEKIISEISKKVWDFFIAKYKL